MHRPNDYVAIEVIRLGNISLEDKGMTKNSCIIIVGDDRHRPFAIAWTTI